MVVNLGQDVTFSGYASTNGSGGGGTPSVINYTASWSAAPEGGTMTWGTPTTVGSTIVVGISVLGNATIGVPTGWTLASTNYYGSVATLWVLYCPSSLSITTQLFSWSGGGSFSSCGEGYELANLVSNTIDLNITFTGSGTSAVFGSTGPSTVNNEIWIAYVSQNQGGTATPAPSGWSNLQTYSGFGTYLSGATIVTASGVYESPTWTLGGPSGWGGAVVSFV